MPSTSRIQTQTTKPSRTKKPIKKTPDSSPRFEFYPIKHGHRVKEKRYITEKYRYNLTASKMQAQAISYILDHWTGNEIQGKQQTISDVFMYALQQTFPRYWTPFYNLEKRIQKREAEAQAQLELLKLQNEQKRLSNLSDYPTMYGDNSSTF